MKKSWTVTLEDGGIMPIPDEAAEAVGWTVGDEIEFIPNGDGSYSMRKCYPRSRIEFRGAEKETEPAVTLTVEQIFDLYEAVRNLGRDASVQLYVDRSSGIGTSIRARIAGELDLTDLENW